MSKSSRSPVFRDALESDVPAVVRLLADDMLGSGREAAGESLDPAYLEAFGAIENDPNNRLIVADVEGQVVGCLQVTVIPHLTFRGGKRLQIEGVRVDAALRGHGIGAAMIEWAVDVAREQRCHLVQLTSNKSRSDALRFYEELGFEPSHVGFKRYLE